METKRNWSMEKHSMQKPYFTLKYHLYCQCYWLDVGVFSPFPQHFSTKKNIHNSKLRRLESWLKRMNILFIKVHFIQKLPTCWTKARWEHRKKLCIYNQFPGSWKSEMFNKVVRKDCRHLCNRFTSGPQAFRKILDSRKTLAESTEKCHVLVLHLYHETFYQATHAEVSTVKLKNNIPNSSRSWWQGNRKVNKLGRGPLGVPISGLMNNSWCFGWQNLANDSRQVCWGISLIVQTMKDSRGSA